MYGADATVSWPPGWSLVRGYFSPATLFLLLNVVIGTIVLTSRSHRRRPQHHGDDENRHHQQQQCHDDQYAPPPPQPAPLARTSSVMERLRSLGLYRFRSGDFPPEYNLSVASSIGDDECTKQQAQYTRSRSEPAARPPVNQKGKDEEKAVVKAMVVKKLSSEVKRLERAPAKAQARLVQRAPRAPARAVVARDHQEAGATAASVDARAEDFINKFRTQQQYHHQDAPPAPPPPAPLARTSSFMERLRSLSLYRFGSGDFLPEYGLSAANTIGDESNEHQQAQYTRTQSEPAARPPVDQNQKGKEKAAMTKVVAKSSSEVKRMMNQRAPRAPAQARQVQSAPSAPVPAVAANDRQEAEAAAGCVDARADDFINKFRQQLQLQRLNSLLNCKEMLNRGT